MIQYRVRGYGVRDTNKGIRVTGCGIRYPLPFTRNPKAGFSFFEAMVTVAILSFGIVMIFQAFLTSLNAFSYYINHLKIQCWANEKIWEVSDKLMQKEFFDNEQTSGNFIVDNKSVDWVIDVNPIDEKDEFFNLSLVLSWKEGNKTVKVWRVAYAGI